LSRRLLSLAGDDGTHVAIPLQGSGTFVVEAAISTLVPPSGKLLVLVNGAYGERMVAIARRAGIAVEALRWPEHQTIEPAEVARALDRDSSISHVALVHCETTTGLLNPLGPVAEAVAKRGIAFLVDAMSSFGAIEIDLSAMPITAVLASSNKCLEGVPGLGFAIVAKQAIERSEGICRSLSLDLHAQWRGFEANGQWRFTPPVQVVAALVTALRLLEEEGGPAARLARYAENFRRLADGMGRLGFRLYLDETVQAPIIATFLPPQNGSFDFDSFYDALAERGLVIYPGKLTQAQTFRIGCIGAIDVSDIDRLLEAVAEIVGS
jgi:2-aminoethylphosphonate-pyruvate transaminase